MIELPEARTISKDLKKEILWKTIRDIWGNYTDHKFTFYYSDPNKYKDYLIWKKITNIIERNFYVEIEIEDYKLIFRDWVGIRYYENKELMPKKSKLFIEFDDESFINCTVTMYWCIAVFKINEDMKNEYYNIELNWIWALDKEFTFEYFKNLINEDTKKLSAKAFLATEQRILWIWNWVLQDILFNAKIHPKTKVKDLSSSQIQDLYNSIINTLKIMIQWGWRDTEKNIYWTYWKYKTILSSKNYKEWCPNCRSEIKKENYLWWSIYYCPSCQKN